jgi:hypothetical protein
VYKITFEEVPHYYYGVHKEKKFNECYMGSPETHKKYWEVYTPQKEYIKFFDYNDEGWLEALKYEKDLIMPVYNTDLFCLNEHCGGMPSLESRRRGGQKNKKNGTGLFSITPEQKSEYSKKGVQKQKEKGIGLYGMSSEEKSKAGKKGVEKCIENGTGVFGMSSEEKRQYGKIGALKTMENKTGIFSLTPEQLSKNATRTNSQKWKCTVSGYVTNAGALSHYQRAKGIDTSNRIRIQ